VKVKNAIRHLARQSTLENLFSKMLLRARGTWASPFSRTKTICRPLWSACCFVA
jgi:hypothetical protein